MSTSTENPSNEKPPPPAPLHWRVHLRDFADWLAGWLGRPRVRLATVGVLLLLTAGVVVTSSVWTLPLVIGGGLMVLVAWIGSRLDGHFAVEWGETGTQLQFRAQIRSAEARALKAGQEPPGEAEQAPPDAEVVEGEAHTVEIDVAELKALIAAAEAAGPGMPPEPDTITAFRVARTARS
ncbi:MAG TPA: hypothetical protein VG223_05735 [Solirubrobacteraceae bacterium]|nr:hypothetical protein [Solirubrobacteraceae bacterium]